MQEFDYEKAIATLYERLEQVFNRFFFFLKNYKKKKKIILNKK